LKKLVAALTVVGAFSFASLAQASQQPFGSCPDEPPSSQPFLAYDGDDNNYFLPPSGDFESEAPGWTLNDGASLVTGPAGTGSSLSLPPGASAVSPSICVSRAHVSARLYGQAFDGPHRDRSRIDIDVFGPAGLITADKNVRVEDTWEPTRQFRLGANAFDLDPTTLTTQIQMRFTAIGPATAVLDDLYIDPSARR
jgi:hypothetical protein